MYLFKDYFSNASALSLIGLVQTAAVFVAMPIAKPCVAKFGKKETASIGMLLAGGVYGLLYFMPNLSAIQFIIISAIGMFGFGFFNIVVWAFVTDVIDYHEYLTGLREDGTVYSIYSFARKVDKQLQEESAVLRLQWLDTMQHEEHKHNKRLMEFMHWQP